MNKMHCLGAHANLIAQYQPYMVSQHTRFSYRRPSKLSFNPDDGNKLDDAFPSIRSPLLT